MLSNIEGYRDGIRESDRKTSEEGKGEKEEERFKESERGREWESCQLR